MDYVTFFALMEIYYCFFYTVVLLFIYLADQLHVCEIKSLSVLITDWMYFVTS